MPQVDTTNLGGPTVAAQEAAQIANLPGESAALAASKAAALVRPAGPGNTEAVVIATGVSGTYTANLHNFKVYDLTLTGATTLVIQYAVVDVRTVLNFVLRQDATGNRVLTFPAGTKWAGGTPGVLSTAANAVDTLQIFTNDGGATFFASLNKAFA